MNTELEQKIMELINGAETAIPEVAQEYLAWGMTSSIFCLIFASTILMVVAITCYRIKWDVFFDSHTEGKAVLLACMIIFGVVGSVIAPASIYDIIKIKTAPKVYLIDSLRSK